MSALEKKVDIQVLELRARVNGRNRPKVTESAHEKSNRLLVYILVELAIALPRAPQWEFVARIHHRSAAYGIFENDLQGASDEFGSGFKYRF